MPATIANESTGIGLLSKVKGKGGGEGLKP